LNPDHINYNRLLEALCRKWREHEKNRTEADFAEIIGISSRQYRNYKNDHKVSKNVISTVQRVFPDYEDVWHELSTSSSMSQEPFMDSRMSVFPFMILPLTPTMGSMIGRTF